jgi:hypothetical protein
VSRLYRRSALSPRTTACSKSRTCPSAPTSSPSPRPGSRLKSTPKSCCKPSGPLPSTPCFRLAPSLRRSRSAPPPLLNEVDTTNGYVLDENVIRNTPLGTGSFTQLAILSPGVNADFLAGTGSNSGLGNQAIWANGQRDSSNSFVVNGISANNLFNGKSGSQVSSSRFTLNTGQGAYHRRHGRHQHLHLRRHRPGSSHPARRDPPGSARQHLHVRRHAERQLRRPHRADHQVGLEPAARRSI